ncbi:putative repeat protein (TIGR03943 family) [Actinokineospora baliensis]|uniref:TIGR03943 family putative permease subunit n=1 Tax=Actinokineospora baliensis TaxID=547056 RepID=UPI00195C54B5|nr:TIGR03943 family protein [Actinokineospora baliensis]MBM7772566.1 putative repeat protein (TIGR03943 family) [Actinokineospora baliensis]
MRRETQNILLVLVGGALLKISFTGAYLQYVKPAHQFWLIGGGAVMVALAVVSIARDLVRRTPAEPVAVESRAAGGDTPDDHADHDHAAHDHAAHDHGADGHTAGEHHHPARSAWLLLLPVLAIFLIAPPALGADSVLRGDNRAAASRAAGTDGMAEFSPLPAGSPVPVAMSEFAARAAWDSLNSLKDRDVQLSGFVVAQAEDVYLARLSIACCAADAFPVKVKLVGAGTAGLANDTWLQVVGRLEPGSATKDNDYIPTLAVSSTTQIPQPENPYEG